MSHLALDGEPQRAQLGLPERTQEQTQGALSQGDVAASPYPTRVSDGPHFWGEDGLWVYYFIF